MHEKIKFLVDALFNKKCKKDLQMDVVLNREFLSRIRSIVAKIPFAWFIYRQYWRFRRWRESQRDYSQKITLLNFGDFSEPDLMKPVSQLCTSNQMLSPIYDYWCDVIKSPARFSRKQWEFVYIMQALDQAGMLINGKRGLGFGCGREPLAGLFASKGCEILATDLDTYKAHEKGWVDTLQHAANLDDLYKTAKRILPKKEFYEKVQFQNVDMNYIPSKYFDQFDFVWSACSLEHLGSLQHGLDFIKQSLKCLKKGGIAVHTTEFNLSSNDQTFETPGCSLYRERDISQLIYELNSQGYTVAPLNLNSGSKPVDKHIDFPPYGFSPHIKLMLEGYVITSIGLIISK